MKVALVLERFDPQRGGLEQWTFRFAQRLVAEGNDVHVLALEFSDSVRVPGIHLHGVPGDGGPLAHARAFAVAVESLGADVVHDMGCGWKADLFHPHGGSRLALREHNLLRIPRWRQIRFWQERRYREHRRVEAVCMAESTTVIVAVSEMVAGHFHFYHGLDRSRLRVIPNGVDTTWFTPEGREALRETTRESLGLASHECVFLLTAHDLRIKNAESALRAVAKLKRSGAAVRLILLGGRKPRRAMALAKRLAMNETALFLPTVDDPRPFYAAADVCLHPTWYDPCSLVTLEAMACGLPVVTTRFNGAAETLTCGREAMIVDNPGDVDALSNALDPMLDPRVRAEMGEKARAWVSQYTFDDQVAAFLRLYREIAR